MTMATNGGEQPQAQENAPQLNVLAQYIKDFSFENPNAPRSLAPSQAPPAINIQINVGVGQLAATDYEVSLKLEGKAEGREEGEMKPSIVPATHSSSATPITSVAARRAATTKASERRARPGRK